MFLSLLQEAASFAENEEKEDSSFPAGEKDDEEENTAPFFAEEEDDEDGDRAYFLAEEEAEEEDRASGLCGDKDEEEYLLENMQFLQYLPPCRCCRGALYSSLTSRSTT